MKIGILTFHHSYNCGSMLQAYALQTVLSRMGNTVQIINFSNRGQMELYSVMARVDSVKSIAKNIILFPKRGRIAKNYASYESFMEKHFNMDQDVINEAEGLSDEGFDCIVAGSDQIWNITIADGDDAYYLPWVKNARKVAYAPSFGAKNVSKFAMNPSFYAECIKSFDFLSIRECNGRRWIKELTGIDVPVVLDPTLLLTADDYACLEDTSLNLPDEYIFYYSPGYSYDINNLIKKVEKRYNLPIIAFNAKAFYLKGMGVCSDFKLPDIENPSAYLSLIKGATAVFTTSFHGTIFSALYGKTFWTIKNGGMFGDDDRVLTLMSILGLQDRLIPIAYDKDFDYLCAPNYSKLSDVLEAPRFVSREYLTRALA